MPGIRFGAGSRHRACRLLHDVTLFNLSFVVKWPGEESEPPGADSPVRNRPTERASGSVTIWIPLDATSVERAMARSTC